jgi:hypothetical protein
MVRPTLWTLALAAGLTGALGGAASADDATPFTLGFPWALNQDDPSPAPGATRKLSQWHISGGGADTFTLVDDSAASYADALALIEKNFTDNHVKTSVNKDFTCAGKAGHMVEFSAGPEGHQVVINRLLVPETPTAGVLTFTYVRTSPDWDPSVIKSMKAYCGVPPV